MGALTNANSTRRRWLFPSIMVLVAALAGAPARADDSGLAPQTTLKLGVVQWNPVLGQYQALDAVSGDLTVAPDRTITVPLVGRLPVENNSPEQLASIIAERIKAKIGLVDLPDVTVSIASYPPIYVIGDVTNSGEFPFRPGMTVLQSLAISGGERRAEASQDAQRTNLLGNLQLAEGNILRSLAHIARYQAELSDATEITFPPELKSPGDDRIAQIVAQENLVFTSRLEGMKRQQKSFEDLKQLLEREIDVLIQKGDNLDAAIASKEKEFDGVKTLVDQGIATVTRRTDLETVLTSLRADRLDNTTATMRARQSLSEAERNLAALLDQQKTDASSNLQAEEAKLEELRNAQATSRLLLMGLPAETQPQDGVAPVLKYSIIRQQADGGVNEFEATETTRLVPGDVVKVALVAPAEANSASAL